MENKEAIMRRLQGVSDPNSTQASMARGNNVYKGGSSAPNNQQNKKIPMTPTSSPDAPSKNLQNLMHLLKR